MEQGEQKGTRGAEGTRLNRGKKGYKREQGEQEEKGEQGEEGEQDNKGNSTNINHKGLQRTANEYAEERRIYKDLISKNNNLDVVLSAL